jgi:hypothetical protein
MCPGIRLMCMHCYCRHLAHCPSYSWKSRQSQAHCSSSHLESLPIHLPPLKQKPGHMVVLAFDIFLIQLLSNSSTLPLRRVSYHIISHLIIADVEGYQAVSSSFMWSYSVQRPKLHPCAVHGVSRNQDGSPFPFSFPFQVPVI